VERASAHIHGLTYTTARHPVVKPPAVVSTAVSHTPTQQQGWGNYQKLSCSLSMYESLDIYIRVNANMYMFIDG